MSIEFNTEQPASVDDAPVSISTRLTEQVVTEGSSTELIVEITNKDADKPQPMVIAQIGVPAGLELRHAKLDELQKSGEVRACVCVCGEISMGELELTTHSCCGCSLRSTKRRAAL